MTKLITKEPAYYLDNGQPHPTPFWAFEELLMELCEEAKDTKSAIIMIAQDIAERPDQYIEAIEIFKKFKVENQGEE